VPEINFRKILKAHLTRLLEYQNAYWKKRCTIRWTKFGDENSKFFHSMASSQKMKNHIDTLTDSTGVVVREHNNKSNLSLKAYID
jgi:hypothetical protein